MKPTKQNTMEAIYLQSSLQFGETLKSVSDSDYRRLRDNYDALLKQPLQLCFFVPCDENGNVLEEPQMRPERNSFDEEDMDYDAQELYDYIKAKEKVLFENLSYKFGFVGLTDSKGNFSSLVDLDFKPNGIIEDLLKEKYKFSFTAFALERIFGKTGA